MTEHVIYVVIGVGQNAAIPVCWRHTRAEADDLAKQFTEAKALDHCYHFVAEVSDVPPHLRVPLPAPKPVVLCIFGSRTAFPTIEQIENGVDRFGEDVRNAVFIGGAKIVSGKAKGADACGIAFAARWHREVLEMPADWATHSRAAGPIRNAEMASVATHGLGFRAAGPSPGTDDMARRLRAMGKPCVVVEWKP